MASAAHASTSAVTIPSAAPPSTTMLKRMMGPSDLKAGLTRNVEEVQKIIYEASKGQCRSLEMKTRHVADSTFHLSLSRFKILPYV
jgi:hypothetical protein